MKLATLFKQIDLLNALDSEAEVDLGDLGFLMISTSKPDTKNLNWRGWPSKEAVLEAGIEVHDWGFQINETPKEAPPSADTRKSRKS